MPGLVLAAKNSGASVLVIQEMGEVEAKEFFAAMGSGWRYDRAGLNVVGWLVSEFTRESSDPVNLSSFGQMQRTLLSVFLRQNGSSVMRVSSSHLAAAASDLSVENAAKARIQQAQEILVDLAEVRVPSIIGADWNSTTTSTRPTSTRPPMEPAGWVFDKTDITTDAKHGIDGTAVNYGAIIKSSVIVDLAGYSDHDGRLVVIDFN